ncbi:GNAT family N-acetyltransferase [Paenibacillus ginsengarvi]
MVEITEMTIEHYERMIGLWNVTEGLVLSEADSRENIESFLRRNSGLSFVCIDQRQVVGTSMCGHDGRRGFLYHVAVHRSYRGQRIAKDLVERSLGSLRNAGITKCHLFTLEHNEIGNRYWSGSGWSRRDGILLYSRDLV